MALHGAGYDASMQATEAPTDPLSPTTMVFNYLKSRGIPLTAGNISQALRDHAGDPDAFRPSNEGRGLVLDQAGTEPDGGAQRSAAPQRKAATLPIPTQPGDAPTDAGNWDATQGGNSSAPPTPDSATSGGLDWLRPLIETGSLGAAILGRYMGGRGGGGAPMPPDGAGVPAMLNPRPEMTPPPAAAPIPIQAMPVEPAVPGQAVLPAPTTGPGSGQLMLPAPEPQVMLPPNLQPGAGGSRSTAQIQREDGVGYNDAYRKQQAESPASPALDKAVGGDGDVVQAPKPKVRAPKARVSTPRVRPPKV